MQPRSFFANGWVLVSGKKMGKSEGNFYTLKQLCENFGADASRIALANAGDTLNDANIELKEVDEAILKLSALEMWMKENLANVANLRTESIPDDNIEFYDRVFENSLNKYVVDSNKHFDKLVLREVIKIVFFGLQSLREDYSLNCGPHGMRQDLVKKYCEIQLILLYPFAPHFCEIAWIEIFQDALDEEAKKAYPQYISNAQTPEIDEAAIDLRIIEEFNYIKKVAKSLRNAFDNLVKKKKKKKSVDPASLTKVNILVSLHYQEWQQKILAFLKENKISKANPNPDVDWKKAVKDIMATFSAEITEKKAKKRFIAKGMEFASNMMVSDCDSCFLLQFLKFYFQKTFAHKHLSYFD